MKKATVCIIKLYQMCISPLFPPRCRFHPSCSEYAVNAIEKKGFFRGVFFAAWRVLRCNPLFPGGYDPVDSPPEGETGSC